MRFQYFTKDDLKLSDKELKEKFHQLAKKHHPDAGGSDAAMKRVNQEYAYIAAFPKPEPVEPLLEVKFMGKVVNINVDQVVDILEVAGVKINPKAKAVYDLFKSLRNGD